jgi:hypothetical protein
MLGEMMGLSKILDDGYGAEVMPKRAAGLTARQVESRKRPGLIADGGGLYLQVTPGGAKTWIFRFQIAGRRRDMGLGSATIFSLAEAREKARAARRLVAEGMDPIVRRQAERIARDLDAAKAMTFRDCAERYITAHRAGWRNAKHAMQWSATLETYVYPHFGRLPVQAVDVGLVMNAIEPIWSTKPETASRVRGRIEAILDWASARGYRQGENPARWRGHLDKLLPKPTKTKGAARQSRGRDEHHKALSYTDIGTFLPELRGQKGMAARALEFAILTAARTGEVIGARWDEIDLAERLWTVPGKRMKGGREHRVPLSDAAMAIIHNMAAIRTGEFLFPGV